MPTLYDQVAYPGAPYPQTHPLRTSAIAALLGADHAEPATARVLEIGCGDAANLIPMALTAPRASFVGLDLAEAPIARGRTMAEALRLTNLDLHVRDILQPDGDLGPFDYVIAHGVYGWVPDAVREALLALIAGSLRPSGLAFLSYNALPGGRTRQALRDMLLYHLGGAPRDASAMASVQALLQTLVQAANGKDPLAAALRGEAQGMLGRDPAAVFHDELCEHWRAFHLHEVAASAAAHGLEVVGDAEGVALRQELFPTALGEQLAALAGGEPVRFQQYQDFMSARLFRQTLLRREGGAPLQRGFDPARARALWAAAPVREEPRTASDGPGEIRFVLSSQHAVKVAEPELQHALRRLGAAWPQAVPIAELPGEDTPEALTQLFTAGHVELQTGPWPGLGGVSERPRASPLARFQLERGEASVTALNLSTVKLEDETGRAFIRLLDGSRDANALAEAVSRSAGLTLADVAPGVAPHLDQLARMGLLTV
jgi:SAM-dependent methyltransferase